MIDSARRVSWSFLIWKRAASHWARVSVSGEGMFEAMYQSFACVPPKNSMGLCMRIS